MPGSSSLWGYVPLFSMHKPDDLRTFRCLIYFFFSFCHWVFCTLCSVLFLKENVLAEEQQCLMWILKKKKNANVLSFNTRALLPPPHSPAFIPQYPESSPISILCPPPPLCGKISIWQNTPGDHQLSWQKPHKSRNAALSCKEQFVSDCKQHVCCRDCNCDCCD